MSVEKMIEKLNREDPEFRKEYEKSDFAFEVGNSVISARIEAGFSQKELAEKVGTKQPSIARIESGRSLPSLSFLERIATALNTSLIPPQFENTAASPAGSVSNLESLFVFPEAQTLRAAVRPESKETGDYYQCENF